MYYIFMIIWLSLSFIVSVLRRYRDFKWLYDELCLTSGGVIVPAIPEKQIIGNLSSGIN